MNKNSAINLAIDALRHEIKEKIWDAEHPFNPYGERAKKQCDNWKKAIEILEELKDKKINGEFT